MTSTRKQGQRTAEVEELLGEVEGLYEDAKIALRAREIGVNENMAFYRGMQWGQTDEYGFYEDSDDTGESQETYNYIRPTVRSAVASMLRNKPNPEAVASHDGHNATARAMATQLLVRSMLRDGTISMEEIYRGETEAAVKGAVWYKVYFDPTAGKSVRSPKYRPGRPGENGEPTYEPVVDIFGRPEMVETFEGKIRVEFVDIIDVLPDPNALKEEEVGYVFHRKLLPRWKLDDLFPVDQFGESTEDRWTAMVEDLAVTQRNLIENAHYGLGFSGQTHAAPQNQLFEIVEFWEKPSRTHPKGRLVVFSGDVVIAMSELPYEWPWLLRNGQNIIPNALYADGVVYDLKPIQRTINLNASKKREWVDKILSPPILAPFESELARDVFSDLAGEIVNYRSGHAPRWMEVPSMPTAMFELENSLVSILKDVSTYSDISRGDAPAGLETGRALAYLHEFQQGVREPDVLLFQWTIIRILRKCLTLVRDFYPDGRTMKLIGENNRWMLRAFYRKDYDFDAEIELEVESGAPSSRALRMAEMSQLFQLGAFEDTPGATRFRRMMNIDYTDRSTIDPLERHRARAREQIQNIMEDPTYQLRALPQENHEVFLEILDDFMVSTEFFALPPIAQEGVERYLGEHEQYLRMQQEDYSTQQALMGQRGGGPGASAATRPSPEMASPPNGGQSDLAGARMPGPNVDEPPPPMREQTDILQNVA